MQGLTANYIINNHDYDVEDPLNPGQYIPRDIFTEIVSGYSASYKPAAHDALWRVYRYRMLGSCDLDYWVQCAKDIADEIRSKYESIWTCWASPAVGAKMTSMDTSVMTTQNDGMNEAMPNTATLGSITYPSGKDHSEAKMTTQNGLMATRFNDMVREYPLIYQEFVNEFDRIFSKRLGI